MTCYRQRLQIIGTADATNDNKSKEIGGPGSCFAPCVSITILEFSLSQKH